MRAAVFASLALLPILAACGREASGAFAAANAASVVVFARSIPDLVISTVTGRDCSVVRLDQGKPYCRPQEPPPEQPTYCTHSLGVVDCWINPEALPGSPPQVADGPSVLTPAQEAYRTRRWPNL